jgi:hypothetical protein
LIIVIKVEVINMHPATKYLMLYMLRYIMSKDALDWTVYIPTYTTLNTLFAKYIMFMKNYET